MRSKESFKRRWWLLLVGAVLVFAVVVAGSLALDTSEFAFLNRYHPTRLNPPKTRESLNPPYGRTVLYLFDKDEAPKVLPALKRELTKAKGYYHYSYGGLLSFMRKSGGDSFGAGYIPYEEKSFYRVFFEDQITMPEGGCAVMVIRERTWLESQVDAVKKFLHWD